ncbi:MAG: S4 domain-containing protein, partial [Thiomonas sp.]
MKPRPPSAWPGRPLRADNTTRRNAPARTVSAPAPEGNPDGSVRLSKRMSELGLASRREADAWIEQGWVLIDGTPAVLGTKVAGNLPASRITIRKVA